MTITLRCKDYGFECAFEAGSGPDAGLIERMRSHFEREHGIDYPAEAITQMITNRGFSLESIRRHAA